MAESREKRKAPRLARWARRAAVALVVLGLLLAGLYATRRHTLHPLLVRCAPTVSRWLGPYEVRLTGLEGDWRGRLAVEGLELVIPEDAPGPLRALRIQRAEVRGDLLAAAMGQGLDALTAVDAEAPRIELDAAAGEESGSEEPIEWPALPHLDVRRGAVRLVGLAELVEVQDLDLAGNGTDADPLELAGEVSAPAWSAQVLGRLRLESGGALRFVVDVPEASTGGVDTAASAISGRWSREGTRLDSGRVVIGRSEIDFSGLTVTGGAASDLQVGGDLSFELPDLGEARRALSALAGSGDPDPRTWSGAARGAARLAPDPDGISVGSIDFRGTDVVIAGIALGAVEARAEADGTGVELAALEASSPRGARVTGRGRYLFAERVFEDAHLTVRLDQPGDLDEGLAMVRGVEVDLDLEGSIDEPSGGVRVRADEVELTPGEVLRAVDVEGTLTEGVLRLGTAQIDTSYGAARADGTVTLPLGGQALAVSLEALELVGRGGDLRLLEPARIELEADDGPRVEGLVLEGSAGRASLDLRGGAAALVNLEASELRLAPFLPAPVDGAPESRWLRFLGPISGTASFDGAGGVADIDLRMPLPDSTEVARVAAKWDGTTASVEAVELAVPGARIALEGSAEMARGPVPLAEDGPVALSLRADLASEALRWAPLADLVDPELLARLAQADGTALVELDLEGTWGAPRGSAALTFSDWVLRDPDAPQGSALPRPIQAGVRLSLSDEVRVEGGDVVLEDCVGLSLSGRIGHAADLALLARDPAAAWKALEDAEVDVTADLKSEGLDELSALLPQLREVGGKVDGELHLDGTVGAPALTGHLSIVDGAARYRGAPPIEAVQLELHLEERQVRVERGSLELGASPVTFEGNVLLGQGDPRIDGAVRGEEVLLVRTEDARVRADLDLEIHGRPSDLTVGGSVEITGGRVRSPFEFRSLLEGGGGPRRVSRGVKLPGFGPPSVKLDARITTREPLSLRGRIARGGIRAEMALKGTAAAPTPVGSVFFDPLELAVPAGTISFPSGLVQFTPANPEVPRIDVVGTTRLAGYDVTVTVSGDYDQPDVELASSPSLPPDDLLLLVLSGQPPSAGGGIEAAGQSVALYVAKDLVRGWFTSGGFEDEDRESFLDRLEVVTGRDVSRSGVLTVEATYKLREGFARERDALYVVLERDSFEDYGLGLRLVLRLR